MGKRSKQPCSVEATLKGSSSQGELPSVGALPPGAVLWGHVLEGEVLVGSSPQGTAYSHEVGRGWSPGRSFFALSPSPSVWTLAVSQSQTLILLPTSSGSDNTVLTLSEDAVTHSNASPHQPMGDLWRDPVSSRNFSKCVRSMARPPESPSPCTSSHTMLAAGPGV